MAPNLLLFLHDENLSKDLNHRSTAAECDADTRSEDLALTATATYDHHPDEQVSHDDSIARVFLLEVLPDSEGGYNNKPAGTILSLDQVPKFRRIGYFDLEWINTVWSSLYDSGSRDLDERRQRLKKEAFEQCLIEEITIV